MEKQCPICGKTEWDYDVANGYHVFCGVCYHRFKDIANEYNLTNIDGKFPTMKNYFTALSYASMV